MRNNKGFTLVEILAVIAILSILIIIAVPASIGIGDKVNAKLYNTKITLAKKSAVLWAQDNKVCFESGVGTNCRDARCDLASADKKICTIKLEKLADENYFDYDNESEKIIEDPITKGPMNELDINIIYDVKSKTFSILSDESDHTVFFNGNDSTGGSMDNLVCSFRVSCSIPANKYTKTGNTFQGWSTSKGGAIKYKSGDLLTNLTKDLTLYAVWKTNEYNLTFNANGGSGTMTTKSCQHNISCGITTNSFTRIGYTFVGWSTSKGGAVKYNDDGAIIITSNTTLYAVWKPISYNLMFNANGGSGAMTTKNCDHNVSCVITTNSFTRTGYTFAGWSTTSGGAVQYNNGGKIIITSDTTLYAKWVEIDLTPPTIAFTPISTLETGTSVYISPANIKISATDSSGIKNVKYCTTTGTTCTPSLTVINNNGIYLYGKTGTPLGTTVCAVATDNANNTNPIPVCQTYQIDSEKPSVSCQTGSWSKTSSLLTCTGTDNIGIRKLEWSKDSSSWTTFSSISASGPFKTSYNAKFYATTYRNYIKSTDEAGLQYLNSYVYAKIDNAPPLAISLDLQESIGKNNISRITCSNNEYLANGDLNPNYNMYANNICTIYTSSKNSGWEISWYWPDDWMADTGYSGVSYVTYNGSCSSSKYTGGKISCLTSRSNKYIYMYTVDEVGNKSLYYLKLTVS